MPMPVLPAITAGIQPPLGVTDTTHPSLSAASTLVVPRRNVRSNSASAVGLHCARFGLSARSLAVCHLSIVSLNGFVPLWNEYGSPGRASGLLLSSSISFARAREADR